MESYLSRWASVSASVRSLTATKSRSDPAALAARNRLRPMRPKPLIPTFTAMRESSLEVAGPVPFKLPSGEGTSDHQMGDSSRRRHELDQVAVGIVEASRVRGAA